MNLSRNNHTLENRIRELEFSLTKIKQEHTLKESEQASKIIELESLLGKGESSQSEILRQKIRDWESEIHRLKEVNLKREYEEDKRNSITKKVSTEESEENDEPEVIHFSADSDKNIGLVKGILFFLIRLFRW